MFTEITEWTRRSFRNANKEVSYWIWKAAANYYWLYYYNADLSFAVAMDVSSYEDT